MGSIYRRSYTDASGRKRRVKHYSYEYTDKTGKRIRISLGVTSKTAAAIKAAKIQEAIELGEAGVEKYPQTLTTPILDLVSDYIAELRRLNREPRYYRMLHSRLKLLLKEVNHIEELTPEFIRRRLGEITSELDLTTRTQNRYRLAIHGLFEFLVRENRWGKNPVVNVPAANEAASEPTRVRRALSKEELLLLLSVVPDSKKMRRVCYLVAATTGFRRKELRLLTWDEVNLEAGVIQPRKVKQKNRRGLAVPIPAGTIAVLKDYRGDAPGSARVFPKMPQVSTLQRDLKKAGIDPDTSEGTVDFHALRVSYSTFLALNVPEAVHVALMRHSDPKLSLVTYTKLGINVAQDYVRKIDVLGNAKAPLAADLAGTPHTPTDAAALTSTSGSQPKPEPAERRSETKPEDRSEDRRLDGAPEVSISKYLRKPPLYPTELRGRDDREDITDVGERNIGRLS